MMARTRIKFCGITDAAGVAEAAEHGADGIGLVFAENSRRRVTCEQAVRLRALVPPLMDVIALFQDNTAAEVRTVIETVKPTLLQFHGMETNAFCREFGIPYVKAVAVGEARESIDAAALLRDWPDATGFLFDSVVAGVSGGTGKAFDWSRIPCGLTRPFLLAGGLTPDNVFAAIMAVRPWGVDVSSGIEKAPGSKDPDKMRRFSAEVARADRLMAANGHGLR